MVNTLGLYGHAIRGSGRWYVLDITLYLLQINGINNELEYIKYLIFYLLAKLIQ